MSKCDQANKLLEIGAQLKQVREIKHIPLHQITSTTLIAERHLVAIEAGDLDQLPEPVYVQGFIRKYGQALGLEEIAEEFPIELEPEPKSLLAVPKPEFRPIYLYALYVGVIGLAVNILGNMFNQSRPLIDLNPVVLQNQLPAKPVPKTLTKSVNLSISTTDESWLQINVDGKLEFEGTLAKGVTRNWSAEREIAVVAGNAGAISVILNDQPVGNLGAVGEVVEKVFTPLNISNSLKPS
ncbi:MAG: DUF4115 domain-containing protein [Pseudanabaenaceae cyanobacterium bins.68]|nr:DUF4115 domain-containing protein [Pseudanabaenaceae cyanobacterium bins.68]